MLSSHWHPAPRPPPGRPLNAVVLQEGGDSTHAHTHTHTHQRGGPLVRRQVAAVGVPLPSDVGHRVLGGVLRRAGRQVGWGGRAGSGT